jgi:DNA-binding XRE family transcriptional regulator
MGGLCVGDDSGRVQLDAASKAQLEEWVQTSGQPRLVHRSRIVLLLGTGRSQAQVAEQLGVSRRTVSVWRQRFLDGGPAVLQFDRPGRGRPKGRRPDAVAAIDAAMTSPPVGQDRWTARALAKYVGVSHSTVLRVWRDKQT